MSGLAPSVRNVSHKKPFFTSQSKMDLGNKQGLVLTGSCPRPVDDESMQSVRTQINKNCCNPWIPLQSVEHVASAFKLVSKLRPLEKMSKGSGESLRLIHHVFARLEACIVFPWAWRPCCSAFGGVSSRGLLRKDTYNPCNLLGSIILGLCQCISGCFSPRRQSSILPTIPTMAPRLWLKDSRFQP